MTMTVKRYSRPRLPSVREEERLLPSDGHRPGLDRLCKSVAIACYEPHHSYRLPTPVVAARVAVQDGVVGDVSMAAWSRPLLMQSSSPLILIAVSASTRSPSGGSLWARR